jgi:general L-amino acid transport system permease protein
MYQTKSEGYWIKPVERFNRVVKILRNQSDMADKSQARTFMVRFGLAFRELIKPPDQSFADTLSDSFSNYEPVDKNLHTQVAFFLSLIFIYTGLSIQKSRSWFFWDQPFDSLVFGDISIFLSLTSFAYLGYLYRDDLFNTMSNTAITLLCFYVIFKFLEGTMSFIFFSANWEVIWVNRRMLAVGPYFTSHGEEIARLWPSVYMIAVLLGCGYGSLGEKQKNFVVPFTIFAFCLVIGAVYNIRPEGGSGHYDYTLTLQRVLLTLFLTYASFFISHYFYKDAEEYQLNSFHQILSVGGILAFILTIYFIDPPGDEGVQPGEWGGLFLNFILASSAIVLGFGVGIVLAFGRKSTLPLFSWPSTIIIETVRSGPLVAWLFIAYILLPDILMPIWDADRVSRTILILALFSGCYLAEILRGGLQAVPAGQREAALSLGLSTTQTNMLIVLPQAVRITMPAIVSNIIGLWKDTSLIHLLGIHDAFQVAKVLPAQWEFVGLYPEALLFVGMIFWVLSFYLSKISQRIEKGLGLRNESGGEMT